MDGYIKLTLGLNRLAVSAKKLIPARLVPLTFATGEVGEDYWHRQITDE